MKSAVVITSEIDDLKLATEELVGQVREKITFGPSAIGIVFCDADVDVAELADRLNGALGFDVVGLTTTASIDRAGNYYDMNIMLTVLTGDDVSFAVGCTGELEEETLQDQIKSAYQSAGGKLKEREKLIYVCSPFIPEITSDRYLNALDELSGHVPVFGGVATDHYDIKYQKTFYNGKAYDRGLVFVLIAGNIRPVFAMIHEFSGKTEGKAFITKSTANQVERVGDRTFVDYITSILPVPEEETVIFHFQSTPFILELPDYDKLEQPVVRALCTVDNETGAGGFLSDMPEGSVLSINILQRENLSGSCRSTLAHLKREIAKNQGFEYSIVWISTCNARHLMMGDTKDIEAKIINDELSQMPADLNAVGYYGFGEMCPTAIGEDGKAVNRYHNISFAVCAF